MTKISLFAATELFKLVNAAVTVSTAPWAAPAIDLIARSTATKYSSDPAGMAGAAYDEVPHCMGHDVLGLALHCQNKRVMIEKCNQQTFLQFPSCGQNMLRALNMSPVFQLAISPARCQPATRVYLCDLLTTYIRHVATRLAIRRCKRLSHALRPPYINPLSTLVLNHCFPKPISFYHQSTHSHCTCHNTPTRFERKSVVTDARSEGQTAAGLRMASVVK